MTRRRQVFSLVIAFVVMAGAAEAACRTESVDDARYVVCEYDPKTDGIRLFLNDASGAPFSEFDALERALREKGETLAFAMNAGMYPRRSAFTSSRKNNCRNCQRRTVPAIFT